VRVNLPRNQLENLVPQSPTIGARFLHRRRSYQQRLAARAGVMVRTFRPCLFSAFSLLDAFPLRREVKKCKLAVNWRIFYVN
jgi:hypothetical protein